MRVDGHNKPSYIKLEIRTILMSLKWKNNIENIRIELTVINTNYRIKINKSDIFWGINKVFKMNLLWFFYHGEVL